MKFKIFLFVIIAWQSLYPVYRNEFYGFTDVQLLRHKQMLAGNSGFYNPWQYRVFSMWVVEGLHQTLSATVYNPHHLETSRYLSTFRILRILQHIIIFYLLYAILISLQINRWLSILGLCIATWVMGNATCASDYSFNTYFDVIFYLAAAVLITRQKNPVWFIPLSILAAFNRETAILIPAMLFFEGADLGPKIKITNKKEFLVSIISGVLFLAIFFGLRQYYGYREMEAVMVGRGWDTVEFNFTDLRSYVELFSVIGLLPLLTVIFYRKIDNRLKIWFWLMVPAWFIIHYYYAAVREARLFLVPTLVVFLPAVLYYVQHSLTPGPSPAGEGGSGRNNIL